MDRRAALPGSLVGGGTLLLKEGEGLWRGVAGNGERLIDLFSSVGGRARYAFDY